MFGTSGGLRIVDSGNNDNFLSGIAGSVDKAQSDYILQTINRYSSVRLNLLAGRNDGETQDEIPTLFTALAQHPDWYVFDEDFLVGPATDNTSNLPLNWGAVTDLAGAAFDSQNGAGGWARILTDATDNDETYIASLGANWLFAAGKPLLFMTKFKHTKSTLAGFVVGLSSVVAADTLVDTGSTMVTTYDGCVFSRPEDDSHILFASSNATVQDSADLVAWTDGDVFEGGFLFDPSGGAAATEGLLTPFYLTTAGDWSTLTMGTGQEITLAGLEVMKILMGVKIDGSAAEAMDVDYVKILAKR